MKPQPDPVKQLGPWPPGERQPARRSFAFDDGSVITSYDQREAAVESKRRNRERERARYGLEPSD